MAAYRFYNPAPVLMDLLGLQPCAGGSLAFYEIGTTTPKNTWSDSGKTVLNPNPAPLDSSGRVNTNVWLDGAYSVRLRDSAGVVIWTRDVDSGTAAGLTIPTLASGQWLTNDGSNLLWGSFFQLPDPTGSDGKIPVASGGGYVLQAQPTIPTLPVVTTDNSVKVNNILDQWGVVSIPASGAQLATGTITFPTPYIAVPNLQLTINKGSGVVTAGYIGDIGASSVTLTGATINWDLGVDAVNSNYNLGTPLPVMWRAIGKVAS
ncbi:hypothetical protein [Stenotrophomonas sp. BIGb0135]|uniref:hypothetical protein n=1 Tax=Stenotrophomonas sp. BIGb0135 TaxID=2940620 RepID=UPI002167BB26|nr:hypothetical protein [Stenotrophomonas sp. BIGb0135]MCS4234405.1 hypothetical protein [Stenotrophomonas sp. BIGb0135]